MAHAEDVKPPSPSLFVALFAVEAVVRALLNGMSAEHRLQFARDLEVILDQYEESGRVTPLRAGFTARAIVRGRAEAARYLRPVVAMMVRKAGEDVE